MHRRYLTFLTAAIALACGFGSVGAQPPDLSGTWVATTDAPPNGAAAPSATFGERFSLRLEGQQLTVIRPVRDTVVATKFALDGSETRARVPGGLCQGDTETIETAARDGDALTITMTGIVPPGGGSVTKRDIKRTFRPLSSDSLVVETSMSVGGQLRPVATVYKRSPDQIVVPADAAGARVAATIAQVSWIAGMWSGQTKETTVEERWTPPAGGSMLATARTVRNSVMTAFEFLCIVERGGTLVYSAMPNGRSPATHFTLTSITADAATFENPAHDFPKMIRYTRRPDGSLETTIAGANGQRAQSSVLKRGE